MSHHLFRSRDRSEAQPGNRKSGRASPLSGWGVRLFLAVSCLLAVLLPPASQLPARAQVDGSARIIRFGTSGTLPPLSFKLQEQPTGYSVDLAYALAKLMGTRAEIVSYKTVAELFAALASGEVDYLLAIAVSPDRQRNFEFSAPYLRTKERIYIREGTPDPGGLEGLYDKRVIVVERHISQEYLQRYPRIQVLPAKSALAGVHMLLNGDGDALVCPEAVVDFLLDRMHGEMAIRKSAALRDIDFCMAAPQGRKIEIDRLSDAIYQLKGRGEYANLQHKWFRSNFLDRYSDRELGVAFGLILLVAILGGAGGAMLLRIRHLGRDVRRTVEARDVLRHELSAMRVEITDNRAHLEEARKRVLAESEQRVQAEEDFEMVFALAPDPICIMDIDGFLLRVNPAWTEVLGYSSEDLNGKHFMDMVHPDDTENSIARMDAARKGESQVGGLESRLVGKSGATIWFSWNLVPVLERGVLYAWGRNVTTRVESAQALENKAEELRRSNEDLEQFAYVASHDLQEPLRKISSFLKLLQERYGDKLDSEAGEFIAFTVDAAARMRVMIEDLLAFSRISTRGQEFRATDMNALMREVVQDLELAIAESGGEVRIGVLPPVMADGAQMAQLLRNLVGNGLKYRRDGVPPRIEISASPAGGRWEFAVADNGIGIQPEYFEKIFKVFHRLHGRGKYPGTGIGLAICKKIVERHGGRIWVESTPDRGSVFKFVI